MAQVTTPLTEYDAVIVIVNYKTANLVISCLEKMPAYLSNKSIAIIIVDNNSNDDSDLTINAWINKNAITNIRLIKSFTNGGFSAGNNVGLKAMKARYYLLLNSDAFLVKNCLEQLIQVAESDEKIGLVSPRLEWPDGAGQESCFRFHSPLSELNAQAKTSIISRILENFVIALPLQEKSIQVQWTSFACVLIRSDVLNDIGYLDEGFFMYFEDVDYCRRVNSNNWRIIHYPRAHAVHLRGGSSPVKSNTSLRKRLPKYYYESRTRYYFKYYGQIGLILANLCWYLGRLIAFLRYCVCNHEMKSIKKQWLDIWSNFTSPLGPYTHPNDDNK